MKKLISLVGAVALFLSSTIPVFAGTGPAQQKTGALAPGHAAGVKQAQSYMGSNTLLWLFGAGIVIGGVALLASSGGHHHATTTTSP